MPRPPSDAARPAPWTALAVAGYVHACDRAPLEEPDATLSWSLLLRGTVRAP